MKLATIWVRRPLLGLAGGLVEREEMESELAGVSRQELERQTVSAEDGS